MRCYGDWAGRRSAKWTLCSPNQATMASAIRLGHSVHSLWFQRYCTNMYCTCTCAHVRVLDDGLGSLGYIQYRLGQLHILVRRGGSLQSFLCYMVRASTVPWYTTGVSICNCMAVHLWSDTGRQLKT